MTPWVRWPYSPNRTGTFRILKLTSLRALLRFASVRLVLTPDIWFDRRRGRCPAPFGFPGTRFYIHTFVDFGGGDLSK